jgi:hypothetical protein
LTSCGSEPEPRVKALFMPLRAALTGETHGPELARIPGNCCRPKAFATACEPAVDRRRILRAISITPLAQPAFFERILHVADFQ